MTAAPDDRELFHEGERAIQERTGERSQAILNSPMIASSIMGSARAFFSALPMLVIGSRGDDGYPSVSVMFGAPGFVTTPQDDLVEIRLDRSFLERDEIAGGLRTDADVGLLAIDLERRRRFRVNGRVERADQSAILIRVREAYPNCPKYIRRRRLTAVQARTAGGAAPERGRFLDAAHRAVIETSDIFFMASMHPQRGADVSHRGGPPGFVRVINDHTLRIPDYPGNGMFNSLGNLLVDNRTGLAFLDVSRERLLRVFGRADVRFDVESPEQASGGTRRFVEVSIDSWSDVPLGASVRWEDLERAPLNPRSNQP
jgi:predicted pyridoxine 5'-phosphate oxidase superfamily flavin-nucleotide-binding protein